MVPSASIPAVRQNRSKLTETASQALSTAPIPVRGKAVNGVIAFFMALLSFRGISTPSLPAQGEQRRSFLFQHSPGQFPLSPNSLVSVLAAAGVKCSVPCHCGPGAALLLCNTVYALPTIDDRLASEGNW